MFYHIEEVYGFELKTSIYSTPANQYYLNNIKFEFTSVETEYPSVPQNLSANAIDKSSISLSWTSTKNATSYNVYCGAQKLANITTTSYIAEGLEKNTEYCFTITAVNENGESEKSAEVCARTHNNVGITELASAINIYPNPASDIIFVETGLNVEEISIYTITGVMVGQQTTDNGQQLSYIDVANLNAGVYFIKVKTEDGELVKRFIKN